MGLFLARSISMAHLSVGWREVFLGGAADLRRPPVADDDARRAAGTDGSSKRNPRALYQSRSSARQE